jgi:hypothetical protein
LNGLAIACDNAGVATRLSPLYVIPSVVEGAPLSDVDCGGPSTPLGMT